MRVVTAEEIRRVLTLPAVIAAMEAGHRRPRMDVRDLAMGEERALYVVRSAVDRGAAIGSKLFTSVPGNLGSARPGATPCPRCRPSTCSSTAPTGAPSPCWTAPRSRGGRPPPTRRSGAKLLAPEAPDTLTVVGAGAMAPWLVRAHRCVRPSLRRVLVWNRTPERARDVADRLCGEGIDAEAAGDLEAAVRRSQIVTSATRSHVPLVKGAWLEPGTHLDLVGGYTPDTREADDEAARRARIFVDRRESALDVGDIRQPIASGAIRAEDVLGDLYDLVGGGVPGRLGARDITLFKNAGGGHLDLMTARAILAALGAA